MSLDIRLNVEMYHGNITHNLNKMAEVAGVYECLWRAEENGFYKAHQLIEPLEKGITFLEEHKDYLKEKYTPKNNWGSYEGLYTFCTELLHRCVTYPESDVEVSR